MSDIFTAASVCIQAMAELDAPQRLRLLSVLRATVDLGDEHEPSMLAEIPAPKHRAKPAPQGPIE